MNTLTRLKFAFARGARIQVPEGALGLKQHPWQGEWKTVGHPWFTASYPMRIHPDDTHLEYGPLSTAMRTMVLLDESMSMRRDEALIASRAYYFEARWIDCRMSPDEARMLGLFVAEDLADQGL